MPNRWSQNHCPWNQKIDRATQLAGERPAAGEVLGFYTRILEFQRGLYEQLDAGGSHAPIVAVSLPQALNFDQAAGQVSELIAFVSAHGPNQLASESARLQGLLTETALQNAIQWLRGVAGPQHAAIFLSRVLLEPQAEHLAATWEPAQQTAAGNRCPICESLPQMAVIRQEGDGGKRLLLCSLCHQPWEFRRVLCPSCGEENHERLPRYTAEGFSGVRVEACDTCHCYLKSVDLTVDGLAVPLVDEIATAPLDLWAVERGYRKILPNLMGF